MSSTNSILAVDSIRKNFGNIAAVDNLSFEIKSGEIFALLGPNGAGKTTTVRMLMNIIRPDDGRIVFNIDKKNSTAIPDPSDLGYLPEERGLYQEIPIIKTLVFMGIIRGLEKKEAINSACKWLEKLELADRKNAKLSTLSKGNQQKVQFIASIIHNPSFVILDEPFSGFDPINQDLFSNIIKDLSDAGAAVLLSAHQMQLVERIAGKVLLINKGRQVASGTVDEIKDEYNAGDILIINTEVSPDISIFHNDDAVIKAELLNGTDIKIYLKRGKNLSQLLNKVSSSYNITSVKTEQVSLHDIFIDKIKNDSGQLQ